MGGREKGEGKSQKKKKEDEKDEKIWQAVKFAH